MKPILIIQARMSSKRLPGKMMMLIGNTPLYKFVYNRCLQVKTIDRFFLAISTDKSDDILECAALNDGIPVFRGSLDNVLDRFISCAKKLKHDLIIRVCGDSPFVDIELIDCLTDAFIEYDVDFLSLNKESIISGLDFEIVRLAALEKTQALTTNQEDCEHVTRFIRNNPDLFKTKWIDANLKLDQYNALTIDTYDDFVYCNKINEKLKDMLGEDRFDFTTNDIFHAIKSIN
jgi:spore coat polysaccharide biosynthesis protein SpsF (cytidylyltransferase family)